MGRHIWCLVTIAPCLAPPPPQATLPARMPPPTPCSAFLPTFPLPEMAMHWPKSASAGQMDLLLTVVL